MTQQHNNFFDDLGRMASGAASSLNDMRREFETMIGGQMESWSTRMNLVTRDEFEAVREMAQQARQEVETLKAEITELKSGKSAAKPAAKTAPTKKPAAKSTAAKKPATKKAPAKKPAAKKPATKTA